MLGTVCVYTYDGISKTEKGLASFNFKAAFFCKFYTSLSDFNLDVFHTFFLFFLVKLELELKIHHFNFGGCAGLDETFISE